MNRDAVLSHLANGVIDAIDGHPVDAATHALDAVLAAVPEQQARQLLDEAAIRRANAIADIAEEAKFGALANALRDEP